MHMYVYVCVEDRGHGCDFSRAWFCLIQGLLLSPEACLLGKAGWSVSPKDPPASAFSALGA